MRASSRSSRFSLPVTGILIGLLGLFFFNGFFEKGLHVIQKPFVSVGTWIYQKSMPEEIQQLNVRLQEFVLDHVQLETLKRENENLKKTLGFIARQDVSSVMASIVSRSYTTDISVFSLDRGSRDGIQIGDPVIVKDGILVGKIIAVSSHSSTVRSLTDANLATAASILNQNQTIGVCEGMNGNLLKLKFIPLDTKLVVNDLVVTSGLESTIPSGLLIGLVNEVHMESNAPFLEAIVEPLSDIREYTAVHVLTTASREDLITL